MAAKQLTQINLYVAGRASTLASNMAEPELLYGATFVLIAPGQPLAAGIRSGAFTRLFAVNPINNERLPIWVNDAGDFTDKKQAVLVVPAHNHKHKAFAQKHGLPIRCVINPTHIREDSKTATKFKQKHKVVAVVENDQGEVLTINWGPQYGGRLTIGGTVETGESPSQVAIREIAEETGYTDVEVLDLGAETFYYKYYAHSKDEYHDTDVRFVRVRLKSTARQAQNLDESEKHKFTVEWVSRATAEKEITEPLHRYGYDKFIAGASYNGPGVLTNSGPFDGLTRPEARANIVDKLTTI